MKDDLFLLDFEDLKYRRKKTTVYGKETVVFHEGNRRFLHRMQWRFGGKQKTSSSKKIGAKKTETSVTSVTASMTRCQTVTAILML